MRKCFGRLLSGRAPLATAAALVLVVAAATGIGVLPAVAAPRSAARAVAKAEPHVVRATLKNGLRVVIVRDTLAPVVTTVVNYQVGSNEAPAGFPGMAHAQEHMMFRGSPGLSSNQLMDIAAAMGGQFDADTQQTVTQYFFTAPSDDVDLALHIEAIRMSGVNDTEKEWKKERGAIEQEVAQDLSNPEYVFYKKLLAMMYRGTPYAHDALGTRPSFNKTTGAMLKAFHAKWYAPNNAILIVAGNVEPQAVLTKVRELFGKIPSKKLPERPKVKLQPVAARSEHLKTDFPYGLVFVSFRMPGYGDSDYAAAEVLADVLSSQRGSLYALVPENKALYTGFALDPLPGAGMGYAFGVFPKTSDGDTLVKQMNAVLRKDVKDGLPADLVEAAKRHEAAQAEFRRNSINGLAFSWSNALAVEGLDSPQQDVDAIEKVTVADVNRVARQYHRRAYATALGQTDFAEIVRGQGIVRAEQNDGRAPAGLGQGGDGPARSPGLDRASHSNDAAQRFEADRAAGIGEQHDQRLRPRAQ
jgi:zinc protease